MTQIRHFAFALVVGYSHLAFACAVEPVRIANLISGRPLYEWSFLSENGETAACSNRTVTPVQHGFGNVPQCDRLFVLSGVNMSNHVTKPITAMLRHERSRGRPIGALCSAKIGFLDGVKALIRRDYRDSFMERSPQADFVWNVFGADQMVYAAARESTAEQPVSLQLRNGMRKTHLVQAIQRMRDMIEAPASPAVIAKLDGVSTRQLERLFGKYGNTSPKKYSMEIRLERAGSLLVQTEMSVIDIAFACGFESPGHFARVCKAAFGVTPMAQRSRLT